MAPEAELEDELHADLLPSIPEEGPSPMAVDSQQDLSREEGEMPEVPEEGEALVVEAVGRREGSEEGEL